MIRFVDLFAGTGGMRLGFEQACAEVGIGSECIFSAEIDHKACQSYELNFGENPHRDITKVESLPDHDFLLAGFPCQSFSYAGKHRGFGDTRGTLFFDVERLLRQAKPQGFLLENVRGLTTHDKGRTFETIKHSLESLGYSVKYLLLNTSNFSVPQNRVRIYILGLLDGDVSMTITSDKGASDSHKFKGKLLNKTLFDINPYPYRVVADILEQNVGEKYHCSSKFVSGLRRKIGDDLNKLHGYRLIDYRGGKSIHSWEIGSKGECTNEEIEFMNLLIANRRKKKFGTAQDGKKLTLDQIKTFYDKDNPLRVITSLIEKGYLSKVNGKYNPVAGNMSFEVFKFLDPDSISITLTASDSNRLGIVQDGIARKLTPRECARLQGFPDSYQLLENDQPVYKQMGNAVSVPVVKAVMLDYLRNNPFSSMGLDEKAFEIS